LFHDDALADETDAIGICKQFIEHANFFAVHVLRRRQTRERLADTAIDEARESIR
jgi:hypothetical protein